MRLSFAMGSDFPKNLHTVYRVLVSVGWERGFVHTFCPLVGCSSSCHGSKEVWVLALMLANPLIRRALTPDAGLEPKTS